MFTANVGTADRFIRIVAGLILVALPFLVAEIGAIAWLLWGLPIVGVVLIATAFLAFCPIYRALGLSTNRSGDTP